MTFEFKVPQRVTITTLGHVTGIVVDRYTDDTTEMNFYRVAFERFGSWSIEAFPEISLTAEPRSMFFRWFGRKAKEKPSEVTRPMPAALGADVKLPPGVQLPPSMRSSK